MRTSCISHPPNEPLVVIRLWQLEFCEGDACAAVLLGYFSYWHEIKNAARKKAKHANDVAEMHGDQRTQDETIVQFHSEEDLEKGIMIYGKSSIARAIKYLEGKGVITVFRNPNERYKFDRTRHFIFYPEMCQNFIDARSGNNNESTNNTNGSFPKSSSPSSNKAVAIPETTHEISTQITTTVVEERDIEEEAEYSQDMVSPHLPVEVITAIRHVLYHSPHFQLGKVCHAAWVLHHRKQSEPVRMWPQAIIATIEKGIWHPKDCPTPSQLTTEERRQNNIRVQREAEEKGALEIEREFKLLPEMEKEKWRLQFKRQTNFIASHPEIIEAGAIEEFAKVMHG